MSVEHSKEEQRWWHLEGSVRTLRQHKTSTDSEPVKPALLPTPVVSSHQVFTDTAGAHSIGHTGQSQCQTSTRFPDTSPPVSNTSHTTHEIAANHSPYPAPYPTQYPTPDATQTLRPVPAVSYHTSAAYTRMSPISQINPYPSYMANPVSQPAPQVFQNMSPSSCPQQYQMAIPPHQATITPQACQFFTWSNFYTFINP